MDESKKFYWSAYFKDGTVLEEENGATLEMLNKQRRKDTLIYIDLNDGSFAYGVEIATGRFGINGTWFSLNPKEHKFDKIAPVCEQRGKDFVIGFKGMSPSGKKIERVIYIS